MLNAFQAGKCLLWSVTMTMVTLLRTVSNMLLELFSSVNLNILFVYRSFEFYPRDWKV